jgi:paraquat-inducible protein B
MSRKASPTMIGAFVAGAIALAVVGVIVFGSGRLFRRTYDFVVYFDSSVNGLRVGAPVKFKGVEVGGVTDILLNLTQERQRVESIRVPVLIEIDADRITEKGVAMDLGDPATLEFLIEQGLRAQLNTESFVTGLLYVALDLRPDSPLNLVQDKAMRYQEIPTLPTPLEEVQAKASEIITRLEELDFRRLVDSTTEAIEGVGELVRSPKLRAAVDSLDGTVARLDDAAASVQRLADGLERRLDPLSTDLRTASRSAGEALRGAEATLASVRALLEPGSPITHQLEKTLTDVSAAARAVRTLAEYLERNPSALLRGKDVRDDDLR